MSIIYGIDVQLNALYTEGTIHFILKKGSSLGFIYHHNSWGNEGNDFLILKIDAAVNEIMNQPSDPFEGNGPSIYVKFEDTYFFFQISPSADSNLLKVSIGGFASTWKKEFWNSPDGDTLKIDFARYTRLMLKLCEDFTIISLETNAD